MKKLLSIALCIILCLSLLPAAAAHADEGDPTIPDETEEDRLYFDSFEELQALTLNTYDDVVYVFYRVGNAETFVMKEDITLPTNLRVLMPSGGETVIPEGVTVQVEQGSELSCYKLKVAGRLLTEAPISTYEIEGIENITRLSDHAWISIHNFISSEEDLTTAVERARKVEENVDDLMIFITSPMHLSHDLVTPSGTSKGIVVTPYDRDPNSLTIDKGCTMTNNWLLTAPGRNQVIHIEGELVNNGLINGSVNVEGLLQNNEVIYLGDGEYMHLFEGGSYVGDGFVYVTMDHTSPAEAMEGFDLTQFAVEELDNEWRLFYSPHKDTSLPGDANGDGVVNGMDLIRLRKYLAGQDVEIVEANVDVNGDGNINGMDLIRLRKYLAGQDVVLQ